MVAVGSGVVVVACGVVVVVSGVVVVVCVGSGGCLLTFNIDRVSYFAAWE